QWEGELRFGGSLNNGDRIEDGDITLKRSFAARHAEWRQQHGVPRPGQHLVAVFDDADPAYHGNAKYADTLIILDDNDIVHAHFEGGINGSQSIGDCHLVVGHPDGSVWLAELVGNRLLKFGHGLMPVRELSDVKARSLAVDPKTGDVWALQADDTIYGKGL